MNNLGLKAKEKQKEKGRFNSHLQLIMETLRSEEDIDENSLKHLKNNKPVLDAINDLIRSQKLQKSVLLRLVDCTKMTASKKYEKVKSVFQMYGMMKDDDPEDALDELIDSVNEVFV